MSERELCNDDYRDRHEWLKAKRGKGCACGGDMPGRCPGQANCPMCQEEETACWNCNESYPLEAPKCTFCDCINSNVDFDGAMKEMKEMTA
jgi:hypothetical protein